MPKKKIKDNSEAEEVKTAPQVTDVAKPGETPPPATGRPIITGHGPRIKQDPMVAGGKSANEENGEDTSGVITKKSELKIEPTGAIEVKEEAEAAKTKESTEPAQEEEPKAAASEESAQGGEEKSDESESETETSDSAAIDSLASAADKKPNSKQDAQEQKTQEKITELIANRKYAVPIVEGGHKASSQRVASWLLLILLLAAVGVYFAIDAGYLDIGVSLPYDIIKN